MNIRQLEYFIAVAQHLNFTKAANNLYVAQSALSQQIADLESKMGVALFIRTKRSVTLTAAGLVFYNEAVELLKQYNTALDKVSQAAQGTIGGLRIGVSGSSARLFMPQLVRRFTEKYPLIELRFSEYSHGELLPALEAGNIDMIFPMNVGYENIISVNSEKIYKDKNAIVMPIEHPLAGQTEVNLSDFAGDKFISLDKHTSPHGYYAKIRMCEENGFTPRITSIVKNIDTILWLIESGMGVAILPYGARHINFPSAKFAIIKNVDSIYTVSIAWLKSNTNPAVKMFLDLVRDEKDSIASKALDTSKI